MPALSLDKLSDSKWVIRAGNTVLIELDGDNSLVNIRGTLNMGTDLVSPSASELAAINGMTVTATQLNLLAQGVAGGYKIARGVAAITGSGTVVTGLTTCVAVIATAQDDLDGDTLQGVSATIGDQAGTPAAGSIILKCWKVTSDADATMVAASAAKNVNWLTIGV